MAKWCTSRGTEGKFSHGRCRNCRVLEFPDRHCASRLHPLQNPGLFVSVEADAPAGHEFWTDVSLLSTRQISNGTRCSISTGSSLCVRLIGGMVGSITGISFRALLDSSR